VDARVRTILYATVVLLCLDCFAPAAFTQEKPDREMLRLMEVLQQWDMIKDLEFMRDLARIEAHTERASTTSPSKDAAGSKKDPTK
jgi:hypothetical protein